MAEPLKKVHIKTFGCQMNAADTELMYQMLAPDYIRAERPQDADLVLINTCAIRRKSEDKVLSVLGSLRDLKRRRPQLLIGVGGCVAQQEGERLLKAAPHLDLVFGTQGIYRLPRLVREAARGRRLVDVALAEGYPALPQRRWEPGQIKAMVSIMRGCDNFCTFCVVPYVRGRECSRPADEIIGEVAEFLKAGGKEVTLVGQNVNSYGRRLAEQITFPELLRRVAGLTGLARLRFATSHPRDLSDDLIRAFGELNPLCEHLHLPVQSGSDKILQAMGRGYTRRDYLARVERLRKAHPGLALSTDLIVGFPGEEEGDFEETLDLVKQAAFDHAFYFKYSPRPQTRAALFPDQVPEEVKAERHTRLEALVNGLILAAHQRLVGQTREVLVEGVSKRSSMELSGRLRTKQVVNFPGPRELTGCLAQVHLEAAGPHSLKGRLAPDSLRPLAGRDCPSASPKEGIR
jgi:tRNA-2-methylthio-N6-dimethylallyladenosine synthase